MLPKQKRIPRTLFGALKVGKTIHANKLFLLKGVLYDGKNARFAVSVSKKVAKTAVSRNKLRRLGYKILGKYASMVLKPLLVQLSWRAKPDSEKEAEEQIGRAINKITK